MTRSVAAVLSIVAVAAGFFFAGDLVDSACSASELRACRGDGNRFALITWLRAAVGVPIVAYWWRPRFPGVVPLRSTAAWSPAIVVFWTAAAFASYWIGDEAFVQAVVGSSQPWLLLSATVIAAPMFEEIVFRGWMFDALRAKSVAAAVVLSSLAWVLVHGQYGAATAALLFAMGGALAAMRWLSGSIWVPIVMHGGWNAWVLFAAGVRL